MILPFLVRLFDRFYLKPLAVPVDDVYSIDKDHWLVGPGVVKMPIDPSWYYSKLSTFSGLPGAIVMHETSTRAGTAKIMAKNRQRKYVDGTDRASSWHVSVEQDGTIVQMAPFNVGCWHAGGVTAKAIEGVGKANRVAVGIERVGFEKDKSIPEVQVEACKNLIKALAKTYGIKRQHFVGHRDLDPRRKIDPGAAWRVVESRVLDDAFGPRPSE